MFTFMNVELKFVAIPTPRATPFAEISRQTTPIATTIHLDKKQMVDEEQEEEEVAMDVNAEAEIEAEGEADDIQEYANAEEAAAHEHELLLGAEAAAEAESIAEAEAEAAAAELAWDFTDEQPKKGKEDKRKSTNRHETVESTPMSKFRPSRSVFGSTKGSGEPTIRSIVYWRLTGADRRPKYKV